jgi:catechol 2,3-dioxygenase-like lactoylglutathione lyase family enzyme
VTGVEASSRWYQQLHSFDVEHPPRLGDSELGFMRPDLESQATIFRPRFQGQGIWITVDVEDAASEYRRLEALGVPIEVALRDEPWGDRHFAVVDPNGIGVDVVQRLAPA